MIGKQRRDNIGWPQKARQLRLIANYLKLVNQFAVVPLFNIV